MLSNGAIAGIVVAVVVCIGAGVGLYFLLRPKPKAGHRSGSPSKPDPSSDPTSGSGDVPDDIREQLSDLQKKIVELSTYAKNTQGDLLGLSNQALRNGDQISLLANSKNIYQCSPDDCEGDNAWQGKNENVGFYKMWNDSLGKSYSKSPPGFPNTTLGGYLHRGTTSGEAWLDGNLDSSNNFNMNKDTWSEFYMLKSWGQKNPEPETPSDPFTSQ